VKLANGMPRSDLRNDTVAGSVAGTPAVDEVARIEEVDDA
jgi:hypothetical protein